MYFEPAPGTAEDPNALVVACIEGGAHCLLLDSQAIPAAFFDLSSGYAGELLHQLGKYRMRLAAVVPDASLHSQPFQDFCREANSGNQFRFFPSRADALAWLSAG